MIKIPKPGSVNDLDMAYWDRIQSYQRRYNFYSPPLKLLLSLQVSYNLGVFNWKRFSGPVTLCVALVDLTEITRLS